MEYVSLCLYSCVPVPETHFDIPLPYIKLKLQTLKQSKYDCTKMSNNILTFYKLHGIDFKKIYKMFLVIYMKIEIENCM